MLDWLEAGQEEGQKECQLLLRDITTLQGVAGVRQGIWNLLQEFPPYYNWTQTSQVDSQD